MSAYFWKLDSLDYCLSPSSMVGGQLQPHNPVALSQQSSQVGRVSGTTRRNQGLGLREEQMKGTAVSNNEMKVSEPTNSRDEWKEESNKPLVLKGFMSKGRTATRSILPVVSCQRIPIVVNGFTVSGSLRSIYKLIRKFSAALGFSTILLDIDNDEYEHAAFDQSNTRKRTKRNNNSKFQRCQIAIKSKQMHPKTKPIN